MRKELVVTRVSYLPQRLRSGAPITSDSEQNVEFFTNNAIIAYCD